MDGRTSESDQRRSFESPSPGTVFLVLPINWSKRAAASAAILNTDLMIIISPLITGATHGVLIPRVQCRPPFFTVKSVTFTRLQVGTMSCQPFRQLCSGSVVLLFEL